MRYIVTIFWALILGQVVGYIGSALTNGTYDFTLTTIVSLFVVVMVVLISKVATTKDSPSTQE
ncbi:MAG: YjzD family protein [Enterococcus sp.]